MWSQLYSYILLLCAGLLSPLHRFTDLVLWSYAAMISSSSWPFLATGRIQYLISYINSYTHSRSNGYIGGSWFGIFPKDTGTGDQSTDLLMSNTWSTASPLCNDTAHAGAWSSMTVLLLSPAGALQLMSQQSVHNSCALCASAPRSVTLRGLPLSVWMAVVSKHFHFEISLLTYDHGIFHKLTLYQWHPITKLDFSELSIMIYSFTIFCKSRLNGEELKFIYNCHSGTENTWIQRLRGF